MANLFVLAILIPYATPVFGDHSAPHSITVNNAGFEEDWYPIPPNTYWYTDPAPSSWKRYNPSNVTLTVHDFGVANPSEGTSIKDVAFNDLAPEGHQVVYIDQWVVATRDKGELGLYQTSRHVVTESTTYTLSVWVCNPASSNWSNQSDSSTFYDYTGFPGYKIQLTATDDDGNTEVLAEDDNELTLAEGELGESVIEVRISSGDPNIGKKLGIRLINKNVDNGMPYGMDVFFDDVRLQFMTDDDDDGDDDGDDDDDDDSKTDGSKDDGGVIAVVIVLLLIVICVAVIVFVWWKKKRDTPGVVIGDADEDRKKAEAEDNALVATGFDT